MPIHREGWVFIALFAAVNLLAFLLSPWLGALALPVTIWCVAFFRDPERTPVVQVAHRSLSLGPISIFGAVRRITLGIGLPPPLHTSHGGRAVVTESLTRLKAGLAFVAASIAHVARQVEGSEWFQLTADSASLHPQMMRTG